MVDISSRMVELENANKALSQRCDVMGRMIGDVKNQKPSKLGEPSNLEYDLNRIRERLDDLEREDSDRHSNNLFPDLSDSRMSLMQKDIEELRQSSRLQLASSDLNLWFKQKIVSFLETPEMADRLKSELRNFMSSLVIQPRNLSKEAREAIVKVIFCI